MTEEFKIEQLPSLFLIYKGQKFFFDGPRTQEAILKFVDRKINNDTFKGTLKDLEKLQDRLVSELKQELDVTPVVQFVEAGSLPVTEGKAKRVIDKRDLH